MNKLRTTALLGALLLLVLIPSGTFAQLANHVVISEVYGGGGNSGSYWKNDFIELYNPTGSDVVMTNWTVQYQSATGSGQFAFISSAFSGTIASHGFFLIQLSQGAGGVASLPTPDAAPVTTLLMGASAGKVALANDAVGVTGPTGSNVVDFVGYGSTANSYEGAGPTGSLSNTTSAERKAQPSSTAASMASGGVDSLAGNGWDANNNSADFVVRGFPYPQNSTWPLETPPVIRNITPQISAMTRSVLVPAVGGTDSVYANIQDLDGTVTGAKLHVRVNGGGYDSTIAMGVVSGNLYGGLIPAAKHTANGNLVEYFISATDDSSGYSSTETTLQGYFVGDAPISSIKAFTPASVNGYAARVNGTLNVNTNLFSSGQGFLQDATAGLQLFKTGGLPALSEGRNAKVQGTLVPFAGAFELTDPSLSFVDTTLGTSALTPLTITLPITQTPQAVNEGRLVKIVGLSTDSTGTFAAPRSYNYREADLDTITIRVESNGTANNLVGRTIPGTAVDAIGILSFNNVNLRLKPRKDTDMGLPPGDGTGTATIVPSFRFSGVSAVAETLTIAGDGVNTLYGVSVTIPDTWTWDGTSFTVTGPGGWISGVTGNGTPATPWVITVDGFAITNVSTGRIIISNLSTPASLGLTTFTTKTRIIGGTPANIAVQPTVNIVSGFEAVATGNWSNSATWSNNVVPTASDHATFTTLNVTVTIDNASAVCNNLTMAGSGSVASSGPVLQFAASGPSQLTVNGNLLISGGSGGGAGDRGGRAQLTSNGNTAAVLIVKRNVTTSSSNSTSNGNAGLNMNEGTVKLTGATSDTVFIGASHRLGNLEIGDGSSAKIVSTAMTVTSATMNIRSLRVKQNGAFWLGTAANTNNLSLGNFGTSGIPTLTGGIAVETGGSLRVQESSAGAVVSNINLFGGGITNSGTVNLVNTTCHYNVLVDTADQTIGGTAGGTFADMTVGAGRTLTLQQPVTIGSAFKMTLNGTLAETAGNTVVGAVQATRTVGLATLENFGGVGVDINAAGAAPGATTVSRVTGVTSSTGSGSIKRYFDVTPTTNTGLNATLVFHYDDSELNSLTEGNLLLFKSTDAGSTWASMGGSVNTSGNTITLAGVNDLSRWTAGVTTSTTTLSVALASGWNLISNPVTSPVPGDSVKQLFPTSLNAYAFEYSGGYVQRYQMANGKGYWGKFPAAISNSITGTPRTRDSVAVVAGWNIVGSISNTVDTNTIVSVPGGLRASAWFGYLGGYAAVTQLVPGKGYWVKSNGTGKFVLANPLGKVNASANGSALADVLNTLTITDSRGGSQTLYFGGDAEGQVPLSMYAMPPLPPVGGFDARFSTAEGGSMVQRHAQKVSGAVEFPVEIQSDAYPVTVSWKVSKGVASYELTDGRGGKAFRSREMVGEGSVKITSSELNKITVRIVGDGQLPKEFALSQNFPNPFNPTTNIKYALPVESRVTMEVYNLLGQKVRTLLSENVAAGYHVAVWDGLGNAGQQLASGVYFLQLSATGTNGASFSDLKKLMLLK